MFFKKDGSDYVVMCLIKSFFEDNLGDDIIYSCYYLDNEKRKELIFEYCKKISKYLHDNKIVNFILLDGSTRPALVAIRQYWRLAFKKEKAPKMYILNPRGFISREYLTYKEEAQLKKRLRVDYPITREGIHDVRGEDEIMEEIRTECPALYEDRDKPLLIFDTCSHSGISLRHIRLLFKRIGFTDIRICTISKPDRESSVVRDKKDWYICNDEDGCYPFGGERSVVKVLSSVKSKRVHYYTRESQQRYIFLRNIIAEKFQQEKNKKKKNWFFK